MSLESRAGALLLATLVSWPAAAQTTGAPGAASPAVAPPRTGAPSPGAAVAPSGPGGSSAAPAADGTAKPAPPAGPVGGYSWTEKPARRKAAPAKRKRRPAVSGPLATYPGFRVLPNGVSELVLRVSKRIDVRMQKANGRVAFVLPSVQVGVRNNTNPLITTHFDTPLARARLIEHKDGAELVLELREAVVPKFSVRDAPGGAISLLITLPPPARSYSEQRASLTGSGALLPGGAATAPGRAGSGSVR
ncbi:MAG TPA: hypothetical protein VI072_04370 [Polyangiaceae bacterium]